MPIAIPGILPITPTTGAPPAVAAPLTEPAIGSSTVLEVLTNPMPVLLPGPDTILATTPLLPLPAPPPVGVLGEEDEGDVDWDEVAAD